VEVLREEIANLNEVIELIDIELVRSFLLDKS
jgi:hypothetical protein